MTAETPVRQPADLPARTRPDGFHIAVMLRALDKHGGIAVYTRNILEELLRLDESNRYTLLYSSPENVGRYADRPNVTERFLSAANNFTWDQGAVPRALARSGADVVFHPKFTVPLATSVPSVMVLHGADWFFPEQAQYYKRANAWYMRRLLPLFCRRASLILSVSKITTENIHRAVELPEGKVRTVYFAPGRHFQRVRDQEELDRVRRRYGLPDRFIFTLSKPLGDLRKNLAGVLEGYRRYHGRTDHKLVVGGKDCEAYRAIYGVPGTGWGADVLFPGWIEQRDLPAVYSLADLFLYPSKLEAFPIPVTEAMACGTPIVTSDANGLREIAGEAAVLVDPNDPQAICEGVRDVLTDRRLHDEIGARGLERARRFNWDRCASETLEVLREAARLASKRASS